MPSFRGAPAAAFLGRPVLVLLALTCGGTPRVAAASCAPATGQSTCFDADALFVPAAPSRFIAGSAARALPHSTFAAGADVTFLHRPVVLSTRAPDPAGREVVAVKDALGVTVTAAYAPLPRLELSVAVPLAPYRAGNGLVGITSQDGAGLGAALRDVRLGAGYGAVDARLGGGARLAIMPRLDLGLPTGDEAAFAGERSLLLWPRVTGGAEFSRLFFGAELGARVREPVELGGTRLGTELTFGFGGGASLLAEGYLDVALEALLRYSPLSQPSTSGDVVARTVLPSEWLLSVRTTQGPFTLHLAGGTALPLSSETRSGADGAETTDHLAGLTAPAWRLLLGARYRFSP